MKNLKISHQLFLLIGALMVAFGVATYFQIKTASDSIYAERYDMLRTQVESGIAIMKGYDERAKAGEMSLEDAKAQAFKTLTSIKFEPNGYLFGLDYNVTMVFHPIQQQVGLTQKGMPDKKGNLFREEMIEKGRKGGGITEYWWEKPTAPNGDAFQKAAYSQAYEPWQVVVGTGVYIDDLQVKINAMIWKAVMIGGAVVALGLIAAYFIINGITKPLTAIHDALEAVADENVSIA
ncbi:cache domain-containing protein, partial [Ciceribacter naphthalenivorans]|uniref:cache domain-containing protein n=2 Tax=Pseudomonadota TaxID=1224 RepID=UPI001580519D